MNTDTDLLLADLARVAAAAARINAARRDARNAVKALAAGRISQGAADNEIARAQAIVADEIAAANEAATGIASIFAVNDLDAAAAVAADLLA